MPEQLVLDQVFREGAGVEGHERPGGVAAEPVQLAGDELLAGPALARDQHGTRDPGHAGDVVRELSHRRAPTHEGRFAAEPLAQCRDLTAEPRPLQRVLDLAHDALHRLGLVDEALRTELDRLDAAVVVPRTRVHDHRRAGLASRHAAQHLEAVHARHLEVEQHAVDRLALEHVERLAAAPGDQGLVAADALQVVRVLLRHGGHVVDHHYDRHGTPTLKGGPGRARR